MKTRTHWTIAAAAAVGCVCVVALLLSLHHDHAKTLRIRSIRIVDASGRPLPNLFSGMIANPRYDPKLIALLDRRPSPCRQSWLDRALSHVETVVYAQASGDSCSTGNCGCSGSGWTTGANQPCSAYSGSCSGSVATTNYNPSDPTAQGETGCTSACAGCVDNACNWRVCANPDNQDCTIGEPCPNGDSDCVPGYSCTSGCCAPTPPPPPILIGCSPNDVPNCDCGYECFQGVFWICTSCGGGGDPTDPCFDGVGGPNELVWCGDRTRHPGDPSARKGTAGRHANR